MTMLFDTHMHADYSCDSHMKIQEAVAAAQKAGVGMILTEHWDRDYPTNPEMFKFDIEDYFAKDGKYRSDRVLLGIEVGMQPHCAEEDRAMVSRYPFDEVVGAMHCMYGKDMYEPATYTGLTKEVAVRKYLEESVRCLELYHDFDSYAHLDYICRYMPYEDNNLYYGEHAALWDRVFKLLIEGNKALEINTRRLEDASVRPPLLKLYHRFSELGGTYATLGSDAHYTEHIGRAFAVAENIADQCGLHIVHFEKRKMVIDK